MAPPRFFTDEHLEPIRNLLDEGLSFRQIAAQYGCDKDTVAAFVRRHALAAVPRALKVLVIDIETAPGLAYIWNQKEPWIPYERIIRDPETLCFASKWLDERKLEFWAAWDQGRPAMVLRAHELLTEADAVVTYNGDNFDLKHLNLEILRDAHAPPAPYKSIDLYKTVRRKFRFASNKLGNVGGKLEIGGKVEHEGFALWEKVMMDDSDAQSRMRRYNEQDVVLTEALYREILPWIEGHASYAAVTGEQVCPNCGSDDLRPHAKPYYTKTGAYAKYQCKGCGKWVRDTHRHARAEITETALS